MENFILKKIPTIIHVLLTFLTCGVWILIYYYFFTQKSGDFVPNSINKKIIFKEKEVQKIDYNNKKDQIVTPEKNNIATEDKKTYTFYINGVTFKTDDGIDRQKILKQIGMQALEEEVIEKYDGLSNKDIIDSGVDEIYEIANLELTNCILEITEYNKKPAIKIYIDDINNNSIHIGWISKEDIETVMSIIKTEPFFCKAILTGGKVKIIDIDEEDAYKEKIITETRNYGVMIFLKAK